MNESRLDFQIADILFVMTMVVSLALPGLSGIFKGIYILFFLYMLVLKLKFTAKKKFILFTWFFTFYVYSYLSQFWAYYTIGVEEKIENVAWVALLSFSVAMYILCTDYDVIDISKRLVPVCIVFVLNILLTGDFSEAGRLSINAISENRFAEICVGLFVLMLFLARHYKYKNMLVDLFVLIFAFCILMSGSRTNLVFIFMFIAALFMFENYAKSFKNIFFKIIIIALIVVAGFICIMNIPLLYNIIGVRVEDLFNLLTNQSTSDESTISRLNMINLAIGIFKENPIFGAGLNNYKYLTYYNTYSHNNYVELLSCLGIVGFLLYYFPIGMFFKKAIQQWKNGAKYSIVPLMSIVIFLLGDLTGVSYYLETKHVFLAIAIGLLYKNTQATKKYSLEK